MINNNSIKLIQFGNKNNDKLNRLVRIAVKKNCRMIHYKNVIKLNV